MKQYNGERPLFHLCDPALDEMGIYNHQRIEKMQDRGWRYWEPMDGSPGFAYKDVEDGYQIRILSHRVLMKTSKYIPFLRIDMFGLARGMQYYSWAELDQYKGL